MSQLLVTDLMDELKTQNFRLCNDLQKCQQMNELLLKYRIYLLNYINVCNCNQTIDKSSVQSLEEEYNRLKSQENESNIKDLKFNLNLNSGTSGDFPPNQEITRNRYEGQTSVKTTTIHKIAETGDNRPPMRLDCEVLGCHKTFSTKNSLCIHMNRFHKKGRLFQCLKCEDLFPDRNLLKKHQLIHINDTNPYINPVINQNINTVGERQQNQINMQTDNDICGQISSGQTLNYSMIANQNKLMDTTSDEINDLYMNFVRKEIATQQRECELGKRLKRFFCSWPNCLHRANNNQDLLLHVRRKHTFEKPFHCEVCGKYFELEKVLKQHKKIHSNIRYKCEYEGCLYQTPHEWDLKEHNNRKHLDSTVFSCGVVGCDKSYKYQSDLKTHHKRDHSL